MDGAPVRCGACRVAVNRSNLGESAGYGMERPRRAVYQGAELMLISTAGGAVTVFGLARPEELGERERAPRLLHAGACAPGPCPIGCGKGFAGAGIEGAAAGLGRVLIRPARHDGPGAGGFPGWLRQRVGAVIWTLKDRLGLERHAARITEGLWGRTGRRVRALNAGVWRGRPVCAPVERSLIAYGH
ncbi:hypothetical protein [Marinactinospora rubrisoli]|uniref:Transposase n=1 Tax=Marinactinospora rubrisoli TaxID=2715399 RepID=A0ABW2KLX2_9ACTN